MFFKGIKQLRTVQWGTTYSWDIRFLDKPPGGPFSGWFPATDVKENLYEVRSVELELGLSSFQVPQRTAAYDLTIGFIDDENHTLSSWLRHWADDIFKGDRVKTIDQVVRKVEIVKLDSLKKPVITSTYFIYPKETLYFDGNSSADSIKYSVPFNVAGCLSYK